MPLLIGALRNVADTASATPPSIEPRLRRIEVLNQDMCAQLYGQALGASASTTFSKSCGVQMISRTPLIQISTVRTRDTAD
jgi:hypothetical protein